MSSMNDYLNNPMGFTQTYRPLPPFAMTQPEAIPSWMPAPVQRTAPYAAVPQPAAVQATLPTYGIGGTYGPDNIDVGGGWNPLSGGSGAPVGSGGFDRDFWFGNRNQMGAAGFALGGAQALGSLFMGMKQYNQAKEQLAFQKESFNKQYAANQSLTNSRLEDRQARRVQENPNATGVAEYMAKWGVK